MSSLVVDASVAVKWFVPEIHSEGAAAWLDRGHDLLAPDLLFSEVGNIVWKKVVRREIDDAEARRILRALHLVPFVPHATRDLLPLAFEVAFGLSRSVYDCMYLALAVAEDSVLVTADRKLYDAVDASVLRRQICWVDETAKALAARRAER